MIKMENKLEILKSMYSDSLFVEEDGIIFITYGRLKQVVGFLVDCGVTFYFKPFMITFDKKELRMIH